MFNEEITCHLKRKDSDWKDCVITSESLDGNYCQVQNWKKFVYISIIHQSSFFERSTKYFHWGTKYCVAILWKRTNENVPWKKISWHVLQIAKAHFSCTIWLMISQKIIMLYTFLHHGGGCMYQKSQQTRDTEEIVY